MEPEIWLDESKMDPEKYRFERMSEAYNHMLIIPNGYKEEKRHLVYMARRRRDKYDVFAAILLGKVKTWDSKLPVSEDEYNALVSN